MLYSIYVSEKKNTKQKETERWRNGARQRMKGKI